MNIKNVLDIIKEVRAEIITNVDELVSKGSIRKEVRERFINAITAPIPNEHFHKSTEREGFYFQGLRAEFINKVLESNHEGDFYKVQNEIFCLDGSECLPIAA